MFLLSVLGSILLIFLRERLVYCCVEGYGGVRAVSFPFVCYVYSSSMNVYTLPSSVSVWTQQLTGL